MKNKFKLVICAGLLLVTQACENIENVGNKNNPNLTALGTENGMIQFAKGGIFLNGYGGGYGSIDDGLGTGYHILVQGMHEAMGDNIFIPWGNNNFKFADGPQDITLDDASNVPNPIGQGQKYEVKLRNSRAYGATNGTLVEWTYSYFMNNACNNILANVDATAFSGDADSKKNTLKAWAHFWKGVSYSRIGSMYVAGVITDEPNVTNGNFVTSDEMIAAGNDNFDAAIADLGNVSNVSDYTAVFESLIPGYCQNGSNGTPSIAEWTRSINTFKARNILVSKRVADMTNTDWSAIKTLTLAGMQPNDYAFVIKTWGTPSQSVIDPYFGSDRTYAATDDPTYFISERLVQDFRPGDDRMANNLSLLGSPVINKRGRNLSFGTRYYLVDGGNGVGNAITWAHIDGFGIDNNYMAGSYEENQLMLAEAEIQLGNIDAGVAYIDEVRDYQGANLSAIGAGKTKAEALEELRSERRIGLLFRGLAFYDARRNGVIDDKSVGGGRGGCVVLSGSASLMVVNTNAFINYNYLDYFDVPKNDLEFNAPLAGSAPIEKN